MCHQNAEESIASLLLEINAQALPCQSVSACDWKFWSRVTLTVCSHVFQVQIVEALHIWIKLLSALELILSLGL